jgi:hypothetical protein
MVALPTAHVERPYAVGAHVAERFGPADCVIGTTGPPQMADPQGAGASESGQIRP